MRARRSTASASTWRVAYAEGKLSGSEDKLRSRLVKMGGEHMARRTAGKLIPFVASPIMAVQNGNAVAELGERTLRFYGG